MTRMPLQEGILGGRLQSLPEHGRNFIGSEVTGKAMRQRRRRRAFVTQTLPPAHAPQDSRQCTSESCGGYCASQGLNVAQRSADRRDFPSRIGYKSAPAAVAGAALEP
jgi:hypothetical protein